MRYCEKCRTKYGLNIVGVTSGAYCDLCNVKAPCYNVEEYIAKKRIIYHVNDDSVNSHAFRKNEFGIYPQKHLHGNIITNKYNRTENRYAMFFKDNGTSYKWISHTEFSKFAKNANHEYVDPDVVLKHIVENKKVFFDNDVFMHLFPNFFTTRVKLKEPHKTTETWETTLRKYNKLLEDGKIDLKEYKVLVNNI